MLKISVIVIALTFSFFASAHAQSTGIASAQAQQSTGIASAQAQQSTGQFGDQHAEFHGWYQMLKRPGDGVSCCSDQDCRPTQWRQSRTDIEVLVNGKWCRVPTEKVLPVSAPDGGAHICTPRIPAGTDPCSAPIFCVIIGSQS